MTNTTPHSSPQTQGNRPRNGENLGLDFAAEDKHWREHYQREPYFQKDQAYDDYAPTYRVGWEGAGRYRGRRFDDVEADLRRDYDTLRGKSRLGWEKAKAAARAAWDRVEWALPGDSDGDGR